MRRSFPIAAIVLASWVILAAPTARAAEPGVRDDGQFFSADAVGRADAVIKQIKQDHGKDVFIETYADIPSDKSSSYSDAGKDAFFSSWASDRYRSLGANGVYVLVCRNPSRVQLASGNGSRGFSSADRDELRNILIQAFRAKRFDDGLTQAVFFAQHTFDQNARNDTAAAPPPPDLGSRAPRSGNAPGDVSSPSPPVGSAPPVYSKRSIFHLGGCFTIGLILIALFVVIRIVRRFTSRAGGMPSGGYTPGPYGGGMGRSGGFGGGGFGGGLLGGILGSVLGGYAQNRFPRGGSSAQGAPPLPPDTGGGIFGDSSGSSDSGISSSGGDFGGGGDSGGGGGGGVSSSGGDF